MFLFRLQSVLDHRKNREEMALREFFEAMGRLSAEREKMAVLQDEQQRLLAEWRDLTGLSAKAEEIGLYSRYIKALQDAIRLQAEAVQGAERTADEKRAALLGKVKDRKVLEKLKERRKKEYEEDLARTEQKILDEVAIRKFQGGGS